MVASRVRTTNLHVSVSGVRARVIGRKGRLPASMLVILARSAGETVVPCVFFPVPIRPITPRRWGAHGIAPDPVCGSAPDLPSPRFARLQRIQIRRIRAMMHHDA